MEEGFKGAGLRHISKGYIEEIKLFHPESKETQKKIVSILERVEKAKEWRKEAEELTLSREKVKTILGDKSPRKMIFIPRRLINIVV